MKAKKLLGSVLALAMVLTLLAVSAFAAAPVSTVTDEDGLSAALAAGGTVTLGGDIELAKEIEIPEDVTVTLDLNGHNITVAEPAEGSNHIYALNNKGILTLKDSQGGGSISARGIYNGYDGSDTNNTVKGAKMTIEGGIYNALDDNGGAAIFNCAELIINGGTFNGGKAALNNRALGVATINGGTFNSRAVAVAYAIQNNGGQLTINNATVEAGFGAVGTWGGTTEIFKGSFKPTGAQGMTCNVVYISTGELTIHDGHFEMTYPADAVPDSGAAVVASTSSDPVVKLMGGTFIGLNGAASGGSNMVVTGGAYKAAWGQDQWDKLSSHVPEGYKVIEGDDGFLTVVAPVAQIGETLYYTLQDAIDNADGKTVTLVRDIELTAPITVAAGKVTLDLGEYTVSYVATEASAATMLTVNSGADLTLVGEGTITFYATNPDTDWDKNSTPPYPKYANNTISNRGVLTVDGVTIENRTGRGGASYAIDNYSGASLTVKSGIVRQTGGDIAIRMFATSTTADNAVTIVDGTVSGRRAVWVQLTGSDSTKAPLATLKVTGGTLETTVDEGDIIYSYSYGNSYANTSITIEGGTFTGVEGSIGYVAFGGGYKGDTETVTITGGTYDSTDSIGRWVTADDWSTEGMLAEGYWFVANEDGTYTVEAMPVAEIDGTPYASLQDAVDKAQSGDIIKLLRDVKQEFGVVITDKELTIDLAGYTFTVTKGDDSTVYRNFLINGSSVVTIQNGKIVSEGVTEGTTSSGVWGSVRTEGQAVVTMTGLKLYNYRGNGLNVKACTGTTVYISDTEIYAQYGGGVEAAGGTVELTNVTVEQKGLWTAPYNSLAVDVNGGGKLTVHSGTYSTEPLSAADAYNQGSSHGSWVAGVLNSGGTLIIEGGTFSNGNYGDDALATAARGAVLADTGANIQIQGGTFKALKGIIDYQNNLGQADKNPVVTITGGTFNHNTNAGYGAATIDGYVPEGYKVLENANGTYTVTDPVAVIGETSYYTLQDAIDNAQPGDTVTLLDDITLTETVHIYAGCKVTLDLNGKTVDYDPEVWVYGGANSGTALVTVDFGGDLTITDSSAEQTGTLDASYIGEGFDNYTYDVYGAVMMTAAGDDANNGTAKLTVDKGTLIGYFAAVAGNRNRDNTEIVINGGKLTAGISEIYCTSGIEHPMNGKLTITGGTIEGMDGISFRSGTLLITGGTIIGTAPESAFEPDGYWDNNFAACTGHALQIVNRANSEPTNETPTVSITGGTFISANTTAVGSYAGYKGETPDTQIVGFITGGTFSSDPSEYVAKGYKVEEVEGEYVVVSNAPIINGNEIVVNADNAQDVLDGFYGSIDGKTIVFSENIPYILELARPTKYEGSNTVYYNYVNYQLETEPTPWSEGISDIMNSHSHYYRTVKNVTFTAHEGVTVAGFSFSAGHNYQNGFDYVRDVATGNGVTYYKHSSLDNITFENLTITGRIDMMLYLADCTVSNITVDHCVFTAATDNGIANSNAAIKFLADNQPFTNIRVNKCVIDGYFQGVYIAGVDGAMITGNKISNTTHNAIALQSGLPVKGEILVETNYISGAADRAIRLNAVGADAVIDINNNVIVNSGDEDGQLIKAGTVAEGAQISLEENWWDGKELDVAIDSGLAQPENVGLTKGMWDVDVSDYVAPYYAATENNGVWTVGERLKYSVMFAVIEMIDEENADYITEGVTITVVDSEGNEVEGYDYYNETYEMDTVRFDLNKYTDYTITIEREGYKTIVWKTNEVYEFLGNQTFSDFGCYMGGMVCPLAAWWEEAELNIAAQPEDAAVTAGENATFTVAAEGVGLTYQWQYRENAESVWVNSPAEGSNTDTLVVSAAKWRDGYQYRCVITDMHGKSVTSEIATLTVKAVLKITAQPEDVTTTAEGAATFTVVAEGDGLTYQWQYRENAEGAWYTNDFTTATMTFDPAENWRDGYQYRCVITDKYGDSVTSEIVTLTIEAPSATELKITEQPQNVTTTADGVATFTVVAEGDGLTYQWQYRANVNSGWYTNAFTTDTMTFNPAAAWRNGYQYRCVVTDQYGNSVTSEIATLTIETPAAVVIVDQPDSVTTTANGVATFTVVAEGDGLTYQWQYRANTNSGWYNNAFTTATMTFNPAAAWRNGYEYRCVVTDQYGNSVTSEIATLTIEAPAAVVIVGQPNSVTTTANGVASFTVVAQGDGLTYQWQYRANANSGWYNNAFTTATMTFNPAAAWRNGYQYRCVVTDQYGNTVTSEIATLTIQAAAVVIVDQPDSVTTTANGVASFTVVAQGDGLTYQWQYRSSANGKWTNNAFTTSSMTFNPAAAWRNGYQYRCVVTDQYGNTVISDVATLTIQ